MKKAKQVLLKTLEQGIAEHYKRFPYLRWLQEALRAVENNAPLQESEMLKSHLVRQYNKELTK